ncbi:serine/arginine repetitive matrix protein 3-like [Protopterus annectens]|uniref:serine/arginine repetitive matrix protein 3-like n=1 Tax=Protopterus annectens TaxID=7888 RepID=UPI001CF9BD85|nr:serine/arginine repetitive matrix protein 3-like [Protopterus annectens]
MYNNGVKMPSPTEAANGFPQPSGSAVSQKVEEEPWKQDLNSVKKTHKEILDHERKRRVELKCMELQEMMEEQGYLEEEIRQKVSTFRQMLLEKEGVLTRDDGRGPQIINENHMTDGSGGLMECPGCGVAYTVGCDCHADCYRRETVSHRKYRVRRNSSSSTSPPPKKKKKKKSGHRRSRRESSSSSRKEKKKKIGKKHKRDRSESGSRKKKRHRSVLLF